MYKAKVLLSFKTYLDTNNLKEPPQEMINKWRNNVIENYSKNESVKNIMNLFEIPKEHKKAIEYHQYRVDESSYQINNDESTITISLKLTITK